ncbi:hypothetical protein [Psychrobacter sp. FDAARGOS_221]|uniref:hypothetical protein n=1 Tax=Psychrobacter sp. FDAARGOS_221 TaxID=1975705 RepID=UPI000BB5600D|nr:hypothetical protein [Psychrobacter sp. FDAARGOS_221]PNK61179.1 hypothetical protein A6J60_010060 [Psychrobacter sp. FDAARGOS_221]
MPATRLPCTAHSTHSAPAPAHRFAAAKPLATLLLLACTATLTPITAAAVTDATQQEQPADPQVAPQADSPFSQNNTADAANPEADSDAPNALDNPNSLASGMQPSDNELSDANQELLSRNAQLQRDVNDLETRVNVLINERSGLLFMYGALSVGVSFILGLVLGGFIFGRRERW